MSHFYGSMRGSRGEATRMGSKKSGFQAHVRGWDIGVEICCYYDEETDNDKIYIYETGGSHGVNPPTLLTVLKSKTGETS